MCQQVECWSLWIETEREEVKTAIGRLNCDKGIGEMTSEILMYSEGAVLE